jgi:predicted DCC family thiol-disulfide oxidoreductase YuxK
MSLANRQSALSRTEGRSATRVFYDGDCPLCRREIAHYRRLRGADRLVWVDIAHDQATLDAHGLSREAAMAKMHVLDAAGQWQTGARAFAEMWSHLPVYRWLARILRNTGTLPVLDRGYSLFARWRLLRRCDSASCMAPPAETSPPSRRHPTTNHPDGAERHPQTQGERSCA